MKTIDVVVDYANKGFTQSEISRALGIPNSTVHNSWKRADSLGLLAIKNIGINSDFFINNGEIIMNRARFNGKHSGLSSAAKKVYEVVPISDSWTFQQMASELLRVTRSSMDFKIMQGCLNSLKEAGLITEPERGKFKRVKVADEPNANQEIEAQQDHKNQEIAPTTKNNSEGCNMKTPMDILGPIAVSIGLIIDELKKLRAKVEDAGVEIEEQGEVSAQDAQKLKQLQALLKGLG